MEQVFHCIIGAVVGGLIGYFTNFLAIRMLFRPRQEIRIGRCTLPFTPGVIPRRKDHLAREIGEAVAEKVFTDTDIHSVFVSEGMVDAVTDGLLAGIFPNESEDESEGTVLFESEGTVPLDSLKMSQKGPSPMTQTEPSPMTQTGSSPVTHLPPTAGEVLDRMLPGKEADEWLNQLDGRIYEKVLDAIEHNDMSERVAYECRTQIRERVKGTVAARVMTEEKIVILSDYLGRYFRQYLRMHAEDLIMPILRKEIAGTLRRPVDELLAEAGFSRERLKEMIKRGYGEFFREHAESVVRQFDIAGMTEKKIIEFRPEEVEALVNRTIKKEMQAVVNLGAVLGIVIGFVASLL